MMNASVIEGWMNLSKTCDLGKNWSVAYRCTWVTLNQDVCEGGGYVSYTGLVTCHDPATRWLVLAGFILWMIVLFLAITVAADAFFLPSIAGIVSYLKISENIAVCHFFLLVLFWRDQRIQYALTASKVPQKRTNKS